MALVLLRRALRPDNVGFGNLVAHNDERLPPGTGYADHPHTDLEIVTWVLSGALRHTSTVGSAVIGPGQVQRLSAGAGVVHSEVADGDGDDAVPAGVGTAGRAGPRARLRSRRRGAQRRMDLRGRRRRGAASYPSRRAGPRCTSPSSAQVSDSLCPSRRGCTCSWRAGEVLLGERTLADGRRRAAARRGRPRGGRRGGQPARRVGASRLGDQHPGVEHPGRVELCLQRAQHRVRRPGRSPGPATACGPGRRRGGG